MQHKKLQKTWAATDLEAVTKTTSVCTPTTEARTTSQGLGEAQ